MTINLREFISLHEVARQVNVLEAEVAAMKEPSGGISKETVEQVLGGPIPAGETEATTLHELEKALRGHNGIQADLIEALEDKLARVTEERDHNRKLANLQVDRCARFRAEVEELKAKLDAAAPSPLTPEGEEIPNYTFKQALPRTDQGGSHAVDVDRMAFRELADPIPEDPRSALFGEMLSALKAGHVAWKGHISSGDLFDLIQRAEKAMEGEDEAK